MSAPVIDLAPTILLRTSTLALGLAWLLVVVQLIGGGVGQAAAGIATLAAVAIGCTAHYRYLGVVLVLSLPSVGFRTDTPGSMLNIAFPNPVTALEFAGIAWPVPLALMLGATARLPLEAFRSANRRSPGIARWMLVLFAGALVLGAASALVGRSAGMNQWSQGVRGLLAIGGFFWGTAVAASVGDRWSTLFRRLETLVICGCVLLLVGLLRGHLFFLVIGLAVAVSLLSYQEGAAGRAILAGLAAVFGTYAVLTFTTASITIGTALLIALAKVPIASVRRIVIRSAVVFGLALCALLIWIVMSSVGAAAQIANGVGSTMDLMSYASFKLLADRGPLWLAAMEQIRNGPFVIVPAGRPLLPELFGFLVAGEWASGAHNSVLELLRNVGMVSGALALALATVALSRAARVVISGGSARIAAFAAAFLGIALPGLASANFPVQDVGFFLWTLAGMVCGVFENIRRVSSD